MKSRLTILATLEVYIALVVDHELKRVVLSELRGVVEGTVAISVLEVEVGALLDEQSDDFEEAAVAHADGEEEGSTLVLLVCSRNVYIVPH